MKKMMNTMTSMNTDIIITRSMNTVTVMTNTMKATVITITTTSTNMKENLKMNTESARLSITVAARSTVKN